MAKRLWEVTLILFVVVIIIELLSPKGNATTYNNYYPNAGVITKLDEVNDIVYFTDFSGNVWSFYGIEDLFEGDIIAVIMAEKGKPNYIYDDEVIDVRYLGYAY